MHAEAVIDASVLGAAFFNEQKSEAARTYLSRGPLLAAPALIVIEITSIAAKKVWRAETSAEVARKAVLSVENLVAKLAADATLAPRALELAVEHHVSAYDALYIALAERLAIPLMTFDAKLQNRIRDRKIPVSLSKP